MTYETLRIALKEMISCEGPSQEVTLGALYSIITRAESIDVHNEAKAESLQPIFRLEEVRKKEEALRAEIYRLESVGDNTTEPIKQLLDLKRSENQIRAGV